MLVPSDSERGEHKIIEIGFSGESIIFISNELNKYSGKLLVVIPMVCTFSV